MLEVPHKMKYKLTGLLWVKPVSNGAGFRKKLFLKSKTLDA